MNRALRTFDPDMIESRFNPDRAKEAARRIREGKPARPLFVSEIAPAGREGFKVITSIGRAS